MNRYLELTQYQIKRDENGNPSIDKEKDGIKFLININEIAFLSIDTEDDVTFIFGKSGVRFPCVEDYDTIKAKLFQENANLRKIQGK